MKKISIILGVFLFCFLGVEAQSTFQPRPLDEEIKGIVYNREVAANLHIHTNGFAFGLDFGRINTYYLTKFFRVEIGELQHAKESRQNPDFASLPNGKVSRAFKFGKQNNFYTLRVGYGEKRYFSEKAKRKGVAVGLSYAGGPTLGILKPYFIEVFLNEIPVPTTTRYTGDNEEEFLNVNRIYGSSGWTKGFGELSVRPGLHGKIAAHFDWGAFDEYVKAIEVGIMLDVFARKIPIMVERENVENRAFFLNLFVNLQFGKRW